MARKIQDSQKEAISTLIEQAQNFFEPHLENLRLSRPSILEQDSEQLELSLATLNTIITHPEQFGFFAANLSVEGEFIISKSQDNATFKVGILPLLLSRKQLILDRGRELRRQHLVKTLAVNEQGDEPDDGEYKPVGEALRASEKTLEILGEARNELKDLTRNYAAEMAQTEGLPEKLDRLSTAVEALTRTVTALSVEARAGRNVSSLVPVAVVQKPVADGAAVEAVEAAPDGPVKKILGKILGALKRAAEWLWSMLIHLATIREWSLGGEVHVPVFAKASLEITFGG